MNPLANTSIILSLEIRKWAGEVSDTKALAAVAKAFNSDTHQDKYKKSLFVTDALALVDRCAGRIRNHFYYESVPWLDGGKGRLIPSRNFQAFALNHKKHVVDFETEVEKFLAEYEDHKAAAKEKKGDLFIEAEYPDTGELRERFGVTLGTLPFPTTEDIRLDAPSDVIEELTQGMNDSIARVGKVVNDQLQGRFKERLSMLIRTLRVGKRFNKSLLTELEFVINMAFNMDETLTDELKANMTLVKEKVLCFDHEQLRNSESTQEKVIEICERCL
jgi:hypothetical protein